jgi:hypothetical protein
VSDLPSITCARCGKPVDRTEARYDMAYRRTELRVFCHGDRDTCYINDELIEQLGPEGVKQLSSGIAFSSDRIAKAYGAAPY